MTSTDSLRELTQRVREFRDQRTWERFHDPKNLVMALSSEVGELSALLRWVDNADADDRVRGELRGRFVAEVGDVGILLLGLCDRAGIDLGEAVSSKLLANEGAYPVDAASGRAERPTQ
jgi:NTP pyrophosphatase (non-canonical NTP hydrolase)